MSNMIVKAKSIFASRLAWTGAITAAVGVITAIQQQPWVVEYPRVAAGLAAAVGVLTIVLRYLTTQPIE